MIIAFHFSDDIGNQKEYGHEENADRNSDTNQADDLASYGVDQNHAGDIEREKEHFLYVHIRCLFIHGVLTWRKCIEKGERGQIPRKKMVCL